MNRRLLCDGDDIHNHSTCHDDLGGSDPPVAGHHNTGTVPGEDHHRQKSKEVGTGPKEAASFRETIASAVEGIHACVATV